MACGSLHLAGQKLSELQERRVDQRAQERRTDFCNQRADRDQRVDDSIDRSKPLRCLGVVLDLGDGSQDDLTTQVRRRFIEYYLVPARSTHAGSL